MGGPPLHRAFMRSPSPSEQGGAQATGSPTFYVNLYPPILTMPTVADPPTPLLDQEGEPTTSGSNRQGLGTWGDWGNSSNSLEASPVVSEYSRLSSNGSGSRNRRFASSPNYSESLGSSSAAIWTPAVPPNAPESGSVSPVEITYRFPSADVVNNMSSDGVSQAGYHNTTGSAIPAAAWTGGSAESFATYTGRTTPKYEEAIRQKMLATRKLDHAKFLKYQEEREKLQSNGVSDPHTAKFKACDNALHIGNMAADVREIKEALSKMMKERTEQLANSRTNAVPGLLSQIGKELEQLNRTNNALTEMIHGDENLIPREFSSTGTMTGEAFHGLGESSIPILSRETSVRTAASIRLAALTHNACPNGNLPGPHSAGRLCGGDCFPKVEPPSSAGPSCDKQPPQPLVQDLIDPETAALKAKVASMTADLADKDAHIAAINAKLQDKELQLRKQEVELSITNEQVFILTDYQEQVHRTLDTYMKMYADKSECIEGLYLRNNSLKNELAQAKLAQVKLAAPSPTLPRPGGLGASERKVMDFIEGDQVVKDMIERRMFERRMQALSNQVRKAEQQSDASIASSRAGPSTAVQTKPLFGSPINRQLDSAVGNAGPSTVCQTKPLFGSTINHQLDSAGSDAGPSSVGQTKPLFGSTMNRQLDSAGSNVGRSSVGQTNPLFGSPINRQLDSEVDDEDRSSIGQNKPPFGRIISLKEDISAVRNNRQPLSGGAVVPKADTNGNSANKSLLSTRFVPKAVDTGAISAARQRLANRKARFDKAVNRKADTAGHKEDRISNASAATAIEKTKYIKNRHLDRYGFSDEDSDI